MAVDDEVDQDIITNPNFDPFEAIDDDEMARSYGLAVPSRGWVEYAPGLQLLDVTAADAELHPAIVAYNEEQARKEEEEHIRAKGMDVGPDDLLKSYLRKIK